MSKEEAIIKMAKKITQLKKRVKELEDEQKSYKLTTTAANIDITLVKE